MMINTPVGHIEVSETGNKDYPGVAVSLVGMVNKELIAVVEYCKSKDILQCVVYNNVENQDEPSDIIEINSAIHESVAVTEISTIGCLEKLEELIRNEEDQLNIMALEKAIRLIKNTKE